MLFKKKKKPAAIEQPEAPPPCKHKYIDFPWYINASYDQSNTYYRIKIYEPYVCILCKHRYDELLEVHSGWGKKNAQEAVDKYEKMYPQIKGRAEVEDQIADMKLLDPYYLDAYYKLYPEQRRKDNELER